MAVHFIFKHRTVQTPCYRSLNLLAHAQLEELDIGSQCGGHGICGGDRLVIQISQQDTVSRITDIEKDHFSPTELAQGYRLGCQVWPNSDELEIRVLVGTSE